MRQRRVGFNLLAQLNTTARWQHHVTDHDRNGLLLQMLPSSFRVGYDHDWAMLGQAFGQISRQLWMIFDEQQAS